MRPLHPCATPSCGTLVRGTSHCPAHTITREMRNPKDPAQAQFYGSTRWKAIRSMVRRQQPICGMCKRYPTTSVHHRDNNWQNNELTNLQGVCTTCHNKHSGTEHSKKRTA